ncbi:g10898 [Coccomyxa viridis]|uniref:G10898 protein n=1 Tax=Coccomyxa viridis TaxID=1274662 RepID=A0ABP1GDL5_9CHLO
MTTREEVVRNRKRLYPAPKPAISREAFRNAYMTLKLAEQRLFHDEALTQSMHGPLDPTDGDHMQTPDNASAGHNSTGPEEDAEPMETADANGVPDMDEQRAEQQRAEQKLKEEEEAAEQERMTQKFRDKEQRRAERQKQQDEEWQQQEQKRREALEAKEKAERELEEQKQQQSENLAELRAKLDGLKAQKQDMVEKLKQVLLTEDTQKERAARLAALEEGEMLLESPAPSSSTPACPHSSLPQLQSRAPWPQKSPALSSGISHGSPAPSPVLSVASPPQYGRASNPAAAHSGRPHMSIRGSDPKSPHSNLPPHLQSPTL